MRQLVNYGKMLASDCLLVDMRSQFNTHSWLAITWQRSMLASCLIRQVGLLAAGPACRSGSLCCVLQTSAHNACPDQAGASAVQPDFLLRVRRLLPFSVRWTSKRAHFAVPLGTNLSRQAVPRNANPRNARCTALRMAQTSRYTSTNVMEPVRRAAARCALRAVCVARSGPPLAAPNVRTRCCIGCTSHSKKITVVGCFCNGNPKVQEQPFRSNYCNLSSYKPAIV